MHVPFLEDVQRQDPSRGESDAHCNRRSGCHWQRYPSQQAQRIFRVSRQKVIIYSESGTGSDDEFIKTIAKLNYGSKQDIDNRTRVMLYLVNRYEQWRKLAEPALRNGDIVITARNWLSTLVYEGYGAGVSKSFIIKLHKLVMPERYFKPDKIFLLTLDEKEQRKRLGIQDNKDWDRKKEVWKSAGDTFQQKLNKAYLKIAKDLNIKTIDASGTIEEVFELIKKEL